MSSQTAAGSGRRNVRHNPGCSLDLDRISSTRVNLSAVERRVATLAGRRSIKAQWQAAWLLRAITLIDLTTLSGDDTCNRVVRLVAKALKPVRSDILDSLGVAPASIRVGAVCVYHGMAECALKARGSSDLPVAVVSTGFPAGLSPFNMRCEEARRSVELGCDEVDIVISRRHVLAGNWQALYEEVSAFREACGNTHMKAILATGELGTLRNVAKASHVCMMAGADFIKTSTGKESVNATLPVALVMLRAIREHHHATGVAVGFKPAGGISRAKQALLYMTLVKEELGRAWLAPERFRFGASSLLTDIERQLEHHATGRYSAGFRHAMG
ncbi:MAG: deoxyribose-phosphate aldolase [Rhodobacteraceae bacterium]|nr:deoxyribose-phosphate aldolase [Paracoccaceae bacterium]